MKVAVVYTAPVLIPELDAQLKSQFPKIEFMNLLDDSLLGECKKSGGMNKKVIRRLCSFYQYAADCGADCVLNTCSSVGEAADVGQTLFDIPIYRIDDAMVQKAVEQGDRIGVIATLCTTLEPTCKLIEKYAHKSDRKITVVRGLAEGAFEASSAGDVETHDQLIFKAAKQMKNECDVILLAQASMQRMEQKLHQEVRIPVYSSPKLCIEQLKQLWSKA